MILRHRARLRAVLVGDDARVRGLEAERGVDPDAVGEPHLGPAAVIAGAAVVGEGAQRDVGRERRVGGATRGAEEGDDLVERFAAGPRAEERQRRVERERGDGQVFVAAAAAWGAREVAEQAHGHGCLVPDGLRELHG
uniref:DUF834 domain-containing protein n=1 Tax=Oryza nivara TaxID=4536 RepID=A0A0E0FTL6_ORYNI